MEERLEPVRQRAAHVAGLSLEPLLAANALYGWASDDQVSELRRTELGSGVDLIDWGEEVYAEQADGVVRDLGLGEALPLVRGFSGNGVTVAVLDSGVDARHPFLEVAGAVSTCPEPNGTPGRHGTHCAGIIASRSPRRPGVAPGVRLIDVKVAHADGITSPGWLAKGIDAALDGGAEILSISFGLNHFPAHLPEGHGWPCPAGRCLLCRAVDHATACGSIVVAAAGNGHLRAQALREDGDLFPAGAELLCPGRARSALTVGAIEKAPRLRLYPPSSRGSTRAGVMKPDLVAPGVDVMSTIPMPEDGSPLSAFDLFGMASGTSVATAVVAGAVALLLERRRSAGLPCTPESIRRELLSHCIPLPKGEAPPEAAGAGRLDLSSLFA